MVSISEFQDYGPHLLSSETYFFPFFRKSYLSIFARRDDATYTLNNFKFDTNKVYQIEAYFNDDIIVNNEFVSTISSPSNSDSTPLYIGTYGGEPGKSSFTAKAKFYYVRIYNGSNLVRDYVPVINSNNRPCMFDKVDKKCYYNDGTDEFLWGTK